MEETTFRVLTALATCSVFDSIDQKYFPFFTIFFFFSSSCFLQESNDNYDNCNCVDSVGSRVVLRGSVKLGHRHQISFCFLQQSTDKLQL